MGANSQQGWALLLFLVGFTFLPAGLFALGPLFTILGLVCLVAAAVWCRRIKPLEHRGSENTSVERVSSPAKKKKVLTA
jgi:membrane-bound ClpP family serine protease